MVITNKTTFAFHSWTKNVSGSFFLALNTIFPYFVYSRMCNKFIQYVMLPVYCSVVNCVKLVRKKSSTNINKDFRPKKQIFLRKFSDYLPGRKIKNSIFFFYVAFPDVSTSAGWGECW